eukprot:XP_027327476.1 uncharacterized protein LOC113845560 [Anas platyrhynchos]
MEVTGKVHSWEEKTEKFSFCWDEFSTVKCPACLALRLLCHWLHHSAPSPSSTLKVWSIHQKPLASQGPRFLLRFESRRGPASRHLGKLSQECFCVWKPGSSFPPCCLLSKKALSPREANDAPEHSDLDRDFKRDPDCAVVPEPFPSQEKPRGAVTQLCLSHASPSRRAPGGPCFASTRAFVGDEPWLRPRFLPAAKIQFSAPIPAGCVFP